MEATDARRTIRRVVDHDVTLLLVRHGEAEGNKERRFIGQSDVPLSDLGRRQALAIADRLTEVPISRIVSSDLQRARDTVNPLAEMLQLAVETYKGLREIENGEWSGLLASEIEQLWPEMWDKYRLGEDVPRPGGERWADVRARVVEAVTEVADGAAPGEVVVVSTHGGPALQLVMWAAGITWEGNIFRGSFGAILNASISTIRLPGPRLLGYNDVGHLAGGLLAEVTLPFRPGPITPGSPK